MRLQSGFVGYALEKRWDFIVNYSVLHAGDTLVFNDIELVLYKVEYSDALLG
jgi:hypothetical protein